MCNLLVLTIVSCLLQINNAEYTILSGLGLQRQLRQTIDNPSFCKDQAICASTPDICTSGDQDIVNSVCPVKCGGCVCEDNASTGGTCGSLVPGICDDDLGLSLCPKSCGFCGGSVVTDTTPDLTTAAPDCVDQVVGISCSELPYPCNNDLGKVACKKFCNLCPNAATTAIATVINVKGPCVSDPCMNGGICQATSSDSFSCFCPNTHVGLLCEIDASITTKAETTTIAGPCVSGPCMNGGICQATSNDTFSCFCPSTHVGLLCEIAWSTATVEPPTTTAGNRTCSKLQSTKNNLGCVPAEIIFMIEYSLPDAHRAGSNSEVDHEGDFVNALVEEWRLEDRHIRVGVIVFHDTAREGIHLADYSSTRDFQRKLSSLIRKLHPSGNADLGKAMDYARENAFDEARPGVEKILVPIIHQTESPEKERIGPAAERLKNSCIGLYGIAVQGSTLDTDVVKAAVSKPTEDYYQYYRSHYELEHNTRDHYHLKCS